MVEILSQRHVPIPVAKALLEKYLADFEENPVLAKVYEYLRRFSKCEAEQAEKAMEQLTGVGFSSLAAAMLVNLMPSSLEEAKALLGNIDGGYDDEKIEKALQILSETCGGA
jgi:DNA-directed RNA polymerase subunit F